MAVKMTKSIQKVFETTKCPHLLCLIPQQLHQHLLLYQKKDSNDIENEDVFDDFESENEMDNVELVAEDVISSDDLIFDLFNL